MENLELNFGASFKKEFEAMKKCLVDEYSKTFCDVNNKYRHCVNGSTTLAKNMSENIGIVFMGFRLKVSSFVCQ